MSHHGFADQRNKPFITVSQWTAEPGWIVGLIAFNHTDEEVGDSWDEVYLDAPTAAAIWTGFFFGVWLFIRFLLRTLNPRHRPDEDVIPRKE